MKRDNYLQLDDGSFFLLDELDFVFISEKYISLCFNGETIKINNAGTMVRVAEIFNRGKENFFLARGKKYTYYFNVTKLLAIKKERNSYRIHFKGNFVDLPDNEFTAESARNLLSLLRNGEEQPKRFLSDLFNETRREKKETVTIEEMRKLLNEFEFKKEKISDLSIISSLTEESIKMLELLKIDSEDNSDLVKEVISKLEKISEYFEKTGAIFNIIIQEGNLFKSETSEKLNNIFNSIETFEENMKDSLSEINISIKELKEKEEFENEIPLIMHEETSDISPSTIENEIIHVNAEDIEPEKVNIEEDIIDRIYNSLLNATEEDEEESN